ncbi:MAG TPA: hypothetical protein VK631_00965 [Solirubrobacteraceae bacterium]|nr:hypothetical protein [Solirubrobacteraceae bacterium]
MERREEAGFELVARLDAVERLVDDVEDRRDEAGFAAVEDEARFAVVEDEARFAAVEDDAGFEAAEEVVERRDVAALRVPVERVDDVRRAAAFLVGVAALGVVSSAETRLPSASMSLRRPLSSWSTRASSTSRIRLAALARSPASSCAGPRSD